MRLWFKALSTDLFFIWDSRTHLRRVYFSPSSVVSCRPHFSTCLIMCVSGIHAVGAQSEAFRGDHAAAATPVIYSFNEQRVSNKPGEMPPPPVLRPFLRCFTRETLTLYVKWTYACARCQTRAAGSPAAETLLTQSARLWCRPRRITMKAAFDGVGSDSSQRCFLTPQRPVSERYPPHPPAHPPTRLLWKRHPTAVIFFLPFFEVF